MEKIGIFYGPQGGSTENVAKKVAAVIGNDKADLIPVKGKKAADIKNYTNIIFGLSTIGKETWDADNPANDWDLFLPEVLEADFSGKVVALFGLGDHLTYSLHFVDSLGILGDKLLKKNVKIVGRTETDDYEFHESKAIFDGKFIGLPVDEDFESEKTDDRIEKWVKSIIKEFK